MNHRTKAFLSCAITAFFLFGCGKHKPEEVAKNWLNSFYHMDYDVAKNFSTESTKHFINNLEPFAMAVTDSERKELRKATITIKDVKVNGNTATLTYTVSDLPGKDQPLSLVKEGDVWLVQFSKNDHLQPQQDSASMTHAAETDSNAATIETGNQPPDTTAKIGQPGQ